MPAKKTPAQLQRDIDEVLARSGNDDDGGSGVQFGSAGTKVSIEPTPSARRRGGKGLIHKTRKYGVLMEDARIGPGGGWDVYDVRLPDGSETSAYGFDLRLAPSAIFREAVKKRKRSHATKRPHILTEEGRLADLQLQGFMKRGPMRTWIVAVEAPSGEPSEATYVEVQGKTEAAALRAAQARKPGRKLTVRYAK
jgi:hypothetical protein